MIKRDPDLTDSINDQIDIIYKSGAHLLEIINDILEVSKIEAGSASLKSSVFNLHNLLDDICTMFEIRVKQKKLQFKSERSDKVPEFILSDEGKLRQILINLLGNAVKFTDEGGISLRIKVEVEQTDAFLTVEVEDSGIGINESEIKKIFDPFQQSSIGKRVQGGTGLGLTISNKYVEMLGGDINIKSNEGTGSLFSFTIPIETGDFSEIKEKKVVARVVGLKPSQKKIHILVVDDRDTNRAFLSRLLGMVGFVIKEATNGKEAIEMFESFKPDIILMDISMPFMDGYEATRRIKTLEAGENTPIIAVTASAFEEDKEKIYDAGCDAFLRKPFKEDELFKVLEESIDIQYIKQSNESVETDSINTGIDFNNFLKIPVPLLIAIKKASISLNINELNKLIMELKNYDEKISTYFKELIDNFAFDIILEFIEKAEGRYEK